MGARTRTRDVKPHPTAEQIAATIDRGHRLRAAAMDRFLRRVLGFPRRIIARIIGMLS
jgi:hypothetical protein